MPDGTAPLTLEALAGLARAGEIDTVLLAFPDLYGRLVGKRFDANYFLEHVAQDGTHACNYLLTVDMEMTPIPGYRFANWEQGYGDFHVVADPATLRRATWLPQTAIVIGDLVEDVEHDSGPGRHGWIAAAPRSVLRQQLEQAAALGYRAQAASELEYYLFRDSYRAAARAGYRELEPGGWYIEDYHALQGARLEDFNGPARRHLRDSGIPVESTKGEWGLGQHEINIRYSEMLEAADRHTLIKQCFKELADAQGVAVTFMAKFAAQQAGSSCHLHASLWSNGEINAFAGKQSLGGVECSEVFRHFLGGWMHYAPELIVCWAPTVNSYKRFQSGSWAPTGLAWSVDNRTAGFRVVGSGQSLRIECRIPGADCNPYLAYAAALAAGLAGIQQRIEPPPMFAGDAYHSEDTPKLPRTLREAADRFAASAFARQAFGETVVDHYAHFYTVEADQYDAAVTDYERNRYFERI